jgi:small subunit ribosomal protein S18
MAEETVTTAPAPQTQVENPKDEKPRFTKKPGGKPVRRRPCAFCMEKCVYIDYKDVNRLRKYLTENGKIVPRRQSGLCARHQREITTAVKRARNMSLI